MLEISFPHIGHTEPGISLFNAHSANRGATDDVKLTKKLRGYLFFLLIHPYKYASNNTY